MDRREIEKESLDAGSQKVVELLGGLKRVEAPSNFEFGVRARIANGAPVEKPSLVPILKVVAPLSLILIVGVIVALYQVSPREAAIADPIASPAPSGAPSTIGRNDVSNNSESASRPRASDEPEVSVSSPPMPPVIGRDVDRRRSRNANSVRPTGDASRDDALRPANIINQPGSPSGNRNNTNSTSSGSDVPVREVLGILGVSGEPSDGGWKVSSTGEGSTARKSGILPGDIIEAIDGQPLTSSTSFKGTGGGKVCRVRRDGKSVEVKLTN